MSISFLNYRPNKKRQTNKMPMGRIAHPNQPGPVVFQKMENKIFLPSLFPRNTLKPYHGPTKTKRGHDLIQTESTQHRGGSIFMYQVKV